MIGEPFYAETSSIDELMDDMCLVVRYLERVAIEHGSVRAPARYRLRRTSHADLHDHPPRVAGHVPADGGPSDPSFGTGFWCARVI